MFFFTNIFIISITYRRIKLIKKLFLYIAVLFSSMLVCLPVSAYEFPPYMGLSLKIEGKVTETYSNNLTFASDKENRVEDFMTMLKLDMDAKYEGKRRTFGLGGQLSRRIKTESNDVRNSSEQFFLNFINDFSEYDSLNINNAYSHTQLPGSFEEEFGRITGRFDSYNNRLNFNYNKFFSKYINASTGYAYTENWNEKEGAKDSHRNDLDFRVNYEHSDMTQFTYLYTYSDSRFEDGGNISTNSINVGIRQYLTKRILFNGLAGMVFTSYSDTNSFEGAILGEIDEKTSADLSYSNTVDLSSETENIFSSWRITGKLKRMLVEKLIMSLSGFYGEGDYDPRGISDTLEGGSALLNYNFWKNKRGSRVNGTLGYSYSELDSNDDSRDYDRNTINASLTAIF